MATKELVVYSTASLFLHPHPHIKRSSARQPSMVFPSLLKSPSMKHPNQFVTPMLWQGNTMSNYVVASNVDSIHRIYHCIDRYTPWVPLEHPYQPPSSLGIIPYPLDHSYWPVVEISLVIARHMISILFDGCFKMRCVVCMPLEQVPMKS